jgi:hypothetical protein
MSATLAAKNSKAIVTLAIGGNYLERWKTLCEDNWRSYAQMHGYDVICLSEALDDSPRAKQRSPAWQKCLVLGQEFARNYERVVWIDSDILINAAKAPCITDSVPIDKVGAVNEWSIISPELYVVGLARCFEFWGSKAVHNLNPEDYYKQYGFASGFEQVVQTGVLVMSPTHHRELLEKVYFEYEEKGGAEWNYEMRPLSYELLRANLVEWIDHRFNAIWPIYKALHYPFLLNYEKRQSSSARLNRKFSRFIGQSFQHSTAAACATTAFISNFFLHFSGTQSEMEWVNTDAVSWMDIK